MQALMVPVKAHVRKGYFVSDEPATLPEGTEVELQLVQANPWADMNREERAELEEEIEAGYRDFETATWWMPAPTLNNCGRRGRESRALEACS